MLTQKEWGMAMPEMILKVSGFVLFMVVLFFLARRWAFPISPTQSMLTVQGSDEPIMLRATTTGELIDEMRPYIRTDTGSLAVSVDDWDAQGAIVGTQISVSWDLGDFPEEMPRPDFENALSSEAMRAESEKLLNAMNVARAQAPRQVFYLQLVLDDDQKGSLQDRLIFALPDRNR